MIRNFARASRRAPARSHFVSFPRALLGAALALSSASPALAQSARTWTTWVAELERDAFTVGLAIVDLKSGEMLFEASADRPFKPASTAKLFTTAAALELLGPEARLETELRASGPVEGGELRGDLWAIGWGDPGLQTGFTGADLHARAEELAIALRAAGVEKVSGKLVYDGRAFDAERTHPEWPKNDLQYEWAAPVTALSVGGACVEIAFDRDRKPLLGPPGIVAQVLDRTTKQAKKPSWHAVWLEASQTWELRGEIPARGEIAPIRAVDPDPERTWARALHEGLRRHGIAIEGGIAPAQGEAPNGAPLARSGTPLGELVFRANKDSLNQPTGCLWKHLGARFGGGGSWSGGAKAVAGVLETWGLSEKARAQFGVVDGSGLSHANRASARLLVETLRAAAQRPWWPAFAVSLPRAGVDGTLADRMREEIYRGRVRAKTGWIGGASALAGTVLTRGERELGFAVLIEYDRKRQGENRNTIKPAVDRLVRSMIESDERGSR
ncbi:MAG: D-alanyl-D-alanine carboxypeptidase/D-alanyl-D-alanine-endopeptidase [Planctomycetes bacterium]|nr:D-alanyl-D-alanine carboxypeptidase/D-alanyl-D-alanine-endopeptidase [Planctomycetota bacterium]